MSATPIGTSPQPMGVDVARLHRLPLHPTAVGAEPQSLARHHRRLIVFFSIFWPFFHCAGPARSTRLWMVGATFILGLVVFPWNRGASTFFIYAAAFLPFMIESSRQVVAFILLECVAIFAEGAFFTLAMHDGPFYVGWANTLVAIFLVIVIGGGNIYFAEQKRGDSKLRSALELISYSDPFLATRLA